MHRFLHDTFQKVTNAHISEKSMVPVFVEEGYLYHWSLTKGCLPSLISNFSIKCEKKYLPTPISWTFDVLFRSFCRCYCHHFYSSTFNHIPQSSSTVSILKWYLRFEVKVYLRQSYSARLKGSLHRHLM